MENKRGIKVEIFYQRLSPDDKSGMVDIESHGNEEEWLFSDIGSHWGIQANDSNNSRRNEFAQKLSALVREYYGQVTPLTDKPLKRTERPV